MLKAGFVWETWDLERHCEDDESRRNGLLFPVHELLSLGQSHGMLEVIRMMESRWIVGHLLNLAEHVLSLSSVDN